MTITRQTTGSVVVKTRTVKMGTITAGAITMALVMGALAFPTAAQTNMSNASATQVTASATQIPARPARITQAIDEKQLVRLSGNVHPMAQAKFDQGPVHDARPMDRMLLLLQRSTEQESALRQLLEDQQTMNSPKHHAWLTPEQFGTQFGPVDADIQATTNWLSAKGFHGIKIGPGRTVIEFSGTAGQVREAFHTEIHRYVVHGAERIANTNDPQIPAALSPVVAGVVSLHNFPKYAHSHAVGKFQRSKETGAVEPLFSFAGCGSSTGGQCNALGPGDLAKIYNIPPGLDGAGQSIAVVGQTNINLQDVRDYRAIFGLPVNDPTIILNGPDPGLIIDEAEADLDVQVSGGVAPKAAVKFVASETPNTGVTAGIDLSALYIVDNNIAAVLSESYGACEPALGTIGNAFYNALWEQAAAQGITVLISSGDNGSAACDNPNKVDFASNGLAVSGIASTPFNMAIGGSDFSYTVSSPSSIYWNTTNSGSPATESAKSYIPESTWSDSCASAGISGCTLAIITADSANGLDLVAASGGPSSIYKTKPAWQTGITGMPNDNKRDLPDVSLFASNGQNNSFYVVCQKDVTKTSSCDLNAPFTNFEGVGGTSPSVQVFAGVMALINQSHATVQNPAPRQGNANYILYKLYKQHASGICTSNPASVSASGCIFYDAITGNISVACKGGTADCSNTSTAANQYGVLTSAGVPAWPATAGYDLATGLGTVNVANLANVWGTAGLTASTTTITASPSGTLTHGANASFTVSVTSTGGTPSGQVSLLATPVGAARTGIGPFTLSSGGTAAISTDMLPGGTAYSVVAHYSGDGTFAQSDSAAAIVTVSKESSKTFVSLVTFNPNGSISNSSANTTQYGSPYILRIDVTNASNTPCSNNLGNGTIPPINTIPCPTGNITVTDNGAAFNDFTNTNTGVTSNIAPLNSHGYLEDQSIQLSTGAHSIVAGYAGDNSFTASTSTANAIAITAASTTIAAASPGSAVTNQVVTLTATIATNSSGVAPTGTVTFTSGTTTLGTAPVVGTAAVPNTAPATGTATLQATFTTTGTKSVTATYSGDTNYAASGPSTAVTINVTPATGTFTVSGTPVTAAVGGSAVSTITVTPGTGSTPGDVQVTCAGTGLPPGVTCTPNPLTITVPGTAAVTGQLMVSVQAPSTTLSASTIPDERSRYASAAALPQANANGRNINGWWTLSAGTGFGAILLLLLPGLGGRKRMRAALGLGVLCVVSFTVGCGGGYGGGGTGGGTAAATTSTKISTTAAKLPSTMNDFAFNITVTSSYGAGPTGQVQLFDGGTALGQPAAVSNGTVSITIGLGAVGTHSITAHYLGNASTQPSMSGALSLTVTGTTTLPLATTPSGSGNISLTIQ